MNAYHLLPPNRTRLEEAFIYAFEKLITYDVEIFSELLDASNTPEETINVLANDKGIRNWDSLASDQLKREQIKSAWPSRARSGTKLGITSAVKGNGFIPHITLQSPYILNIKASHEGLSPLTEKNISVLSSQLVDAVNARDKFNLSIGISATGLEKHAASIATETRLTIKS